MEQRILSHAQNGVVGLTRDHDFKLSKKRKLEMSYFLKKTSSTKFVAAWKNSRSTKRKSFSSKS